MTGKSRAEIRIRAQEIVRGTTVRITLDQDVLFAAGDVLELEISEITGPYVISAVREMNEDNWPKRWWRAEDWPEPHDPNDDDPFLLSDGHRAGHG